MLTDMADILDTVRRLRRKNHYVSEVGSASALRLKKERKNIL
jgi:threonine synthase